MIADVITWKKRSALPNNTSPNKCTRICEYVCVFCRKEEYDTFKTSNVDLGFLKSFAIYKIEKSNNEQLCYMHIDTTSWNEEYKSGNKFFCMLNPAQRKELAESLSKNDLSVLNKYFNTPTICKYTLKPLINLK